MTTTKEKAGGALTSPASNKSTVQSKLVSKHSRSPRKIIRTLEGLTRRSWNRFEAERLLHDHCLHSTVSEIQRDYGITIARKFETVPGYMSLPTRCCRYWLAPDQKAKAVKILGGVV